MTVRTRLVATMVAVILLVTAPAFYGVNKLTELRDIVLLRQSEHAGAYLSLGRIQTALAELNRFQRSYVVAPSPDLRLEMRRAVSNARFDLSQLATIGYAGVADPVQARLDTLDLASGRLERLIRSGRPEEATSYFEEIKPVYSRTESLLARIGGEIDQQGRQDAQRAVQVSVSAAQQTIIALWISLGLALALGLTTIGRLMSPVGELREAMAHVADGSFVASEDLPYEREDEIGDLARSFRSMTERLDELDKLKADFVSVASHELKTPIHIINGYAEMIEEGTLGEIDGRKFEALERIREQTRVLTERVNQLLNLTRFQAGGLTLDIQEVRTSDLLTDVRHSFEVLAAQEGIDFDVRMEPSAPAKIEVDRDRVAHELLGNLLSNAMKFTPAGGSVRVRAWGDDGRLVMHVADTGTGIPTEQLPYVFEKYYQAGKKGRAIGAGLGLAIARQIVEAHGGEISAQSVQNEGTIFEIVLPAQNGAASVTSVASRSRSLPGAAL